MSSKVSLPSVCAATLILFVSASSLADNCQNGPVQVDISSQPVSQAVKLLSKQIGCPISVDANLENRTSHSVKGTMTPPDAIAALARGTGLEGVVLRQGLGIGHYEQKAFQIKTDEVLAKVRQRISEHRLTAAQGKKIQDSMKMLMEDLKKSVREQGFLSAGEKASYQRTLDEANVQLQSK